MLALDQEFAAIPARGTEHGARNLVVGDLPHHEARVARVGGGNEYAGNLHRGIGQVVTALAGVHRIEVGGPAGNVPAAVFLLVAHVAEQLEFGRVVGAALLVTAEGYHVAAATLHRAGKALRHGGAVIAQRAKHRELADVKALGGKVRNLLREVVHRDIHLENVRAHLRDAVVGRGRGEHRDVLEVAAEPGGNGRGGRAHDGADDCDDTILVHRLLGSHEGDRGVGAGIGDADAHLLAEAGLFVGEVHAPHRGGAEFCKVTRKRREHQDGGLAGAKTLEGFEALLGRSGKVLGDTAVQYLLVPVAGGAVALGVLAFAAHLELHPAHHVLVDRVLFHKRLQLVGIQEACRKRLDGDILRVALRGRVLGIGENAEHRLDTLVDGTLLGEHDGACKFHALAVLGSHMVLEELGGKLQGIGTLVFAQVALREEHCGLGTFVLAEALGIGKFLERGSRLGTLAFADEGLGLRHVVLGKEGRSERAHNEKR